MAASFELFVARRYLKARRKEAVISVSVIQNGSADNSVTVVPGT